MIEVHWAMLFAGALVVLLIGYRAGVDISISWRRRQLRKAREKMDLAIIAGEARRAQP